MPDDRMVCKTCFQPVDRVFDVPYEGAPESEQVLVGWMHPRRFDAGHPAEPISSSEAPFIDQVCDFCGEPNIDWIFPTDVEQAREFAGMKYVEEAWAACQLCHDAIITSLTGQAIARRIASRSLPLRQVPKHIQQHFVDVVLAGQYQQFLQARTGDPITLAEYIA